MSSSIAFEDFIKALQEVPEGSEGSIEFLIRSMGSDQGSLLRLCGIPHQFNPEILQVLDPALTAGNAKDICDQFVELSIVIASTGVLQLHDDAHRYLFNGWLEDGQREVFSHASARLKAYYEKISSTATGAEKTAADHQTIFHYIGADSMKGFEAFEKAFRAARYRFALNECESLLNLVHEYDPVLNPSQKHWLAYHEGKLEIAFRNWKRAEELYEEIINNEKSAALLARTLFRLGVSHAAQRQWENAISDYSKALAIARANPDVQCKEHRILDGMATAYRQINDLDQAEILIKESIHIAMNTEDVSALASSYNSLGIIQRLRGDAKSAIEYFRKSLECLEQYNEVFRKAQLYNNLGLAHADLAQWKESQFYLESSLDLETKAGDTAGQAKALANLGRVYLVQDEEARAFAVAEKSVALSLQIRDWYHAGIVRRAEARVLKRLNRIEEATKYYADAIDLLKKAKEINEAERTELEREKLGTKKRIPWYAWVAISITVLTFILFMLLLILAILDEI